MKDIIVIGTGGHSRPIIATIVLLKNWVLKGIIDLKYQKQDEVILGKNVIGSIEKLSEFDPKKTDVFLAIGDIDLRMKTFQYPLLKEFNFPNIMHPSAIIDSSSCCGYGNFVGPFSHIGPMVKTGNFNIINSYANLEHESTLGSFCNISPAATVCGRCNIGDQAFLGANSVILEKLKIAKKTTVGAGAVILKNVESENQTLIGIPGKKNGN